MKIRKLHLYINKIHKLQNVYRRCYCEFLPISETKIIKNKKEAVRCNLKAQLQPETSAEPEKLNVEASKEFRVNEVNIQMVSANIYKQLFKNPNPPADPILVKRCQENLVKHGINYKDIDRLPDVELKLPELQGADIEEHFYNIGEQQAAPYRKLLQILANNKLPLKPKKWSKTAGWCRYEGDKATPLPCPPDDALILDVEVLMSAGKRPTLACAVSADSWYGWVSEPVAKNVPHECYDNVNYEDLIPLETDGDQPFGDLTRPRIVVGHNVSYDRSKVKEQYWIQKTGVRFMDTMSMHTCVSGVTSYQRAVLKSKDIQPEDHDWMENSSLNSLTEVHNLYCGSTINKETRDIFVEGNMEDVHKNFQKLMTYCAGDVIATHDVLRELLPMFLERFPHPVTLAGMLELGSAYLPVDSSWVQYIESAEAVYEDLKLESKQLLSQRADEACSLMRNEAYKKDLWMWDQDWSTQTLKLKKATKSKKKIETKRAIHDDTEKTNGNHVNNIENVNKEIKEYETLCPEYIQSIDYKPERTEIPKELSKKFEYLFELGKLLPVKRPYLPGYPAWYRKLCTKPGKDPDWEPGANNITTSMQITPKLLRLSWEGYPLHYIQSEGWGFLVPFSRTGESGTENTDEPEVPLEQLVEACPMASKDNEVRSEAYVLPKTVEEDQARRAYYARKKKDEQAAANQYHGLGVWCGLQIQGCCHFIRLPHKDGPKYKVGNPLARDFLDMFSQNVLTAQKHEAEKVLTFGRMMTYWRNNRERIRGQVVVWLPPHARPAPLRAAGRQGAILPQVVVCGTLTRRASEPTWMTASNAHPERVGSELRAMVRAPSGYKLVGADVDSQELWIAALLGDSSVGLCGGTALGWAVVAGDKARRSDLHSLTAAAAGVSRHHAKVINYARIYGAGQNFAERLLKQFNPTMTISEAKSKALKMFTTTKGRRVYRLKDKYSEGFIDDEDGNQCVEMSSYQAMRLAKMSGKRVEDMFERGRWVGGSESDMFNKLEQIADSDSPATSFLGGRLSRALCGAGGRWGGTRLNWAVQSAAADFLHLMLASMAHLSPHARFCLSFHDEVRYLVRDELKYETALALQITNLFTRAFCSQRVGIRDLPLSVSFFSLVEVDTVLRKEATASCVTPSCRAIPPGHAFDIHSLIKLCNSVNTGNNKESEN